MYRLTVLYGRPTDPDAFDAYYRDVHLPLARKMRGITAWNLTWIGAQAGMEDSPIHLIADIYTKDKAAMDRLLESPEGVAAREDLANFVTGSTTFLYGDEEPVERP